MLEENYINNIGPFYVRVYRYDYHVLIEIRDVRSIHQVIVEHRNTIPTGLSNAAKVYEHLTTNLKGTSNYNVVD